MHISDSLRGDKAVTFFTQSFTGPEQVFQDIFLQCVHDQLSKPNSNYHVVGVNITSDHLKADISQFTSLQDFAQLSKHLSGKLGKIYVNYHTPMTQVPANYSQFVQQLHSEGRFRTPITVPKLIEFSIFHQAQQL